MSAVMRQVKRPWSFDVSSDVPEVLAQLAERAFVSSTEFLEVLVTGAVSVIVRGQPAGTNATFIARVRELAAQAKHPRAERSTSWSIGHAYMEGIRQLQNGLELPRLGLVVEYLVRAAWDLRDPDDGSEDDELERRRKAASQNLQLGRPRHVRSVPLTHRTQPDPLPGQYKFRLLLEEELSE